MDIKEHVEKIYEIEQTRLVNDFKVRGIELWPLCRYHILLQFRNPDSYFKIKYKRITKPWWKLVLSSVLLLLKKNRIERLKRSFPSNVGILLYASDKKDVQINQQWYNKFIDPFYDFVSTNGAEEVVKVELGWAKNKTGKRKKYVDALVIYQDDFFQLRLPETSTY